MSRPTLTALLLGAAAVLGAVVLLRGSSRAGGPEPIRYGRDTCQRCRMHFAQPGYAAERRDAQGALHKYDDIGCMLIAASHEATGDAWVEDHDGSGWVPLLAAALVAGDGLGTPMNYGVVAFRDRARAEAFAREHGAKVTPLEDLLRDERRFAGAHHMEAQR